MSTDALFRRLPVITKSLGGKFYIPAESSEAIPPREVFIRIQNYLVDLVNDLNDYVADAQRRSTVNIQRCCYSDAIFDPKSHETIGLRINGKDVYLSPESIEDAYWDENFPPPKTAPDKTLPGGMVIHDDTLESFHHKIRQEWTGDRINWTMEAEHMSKTPFRRVIQHMGWKPGIPLMEQSPEWKAATPRHLYST